MTALYFRNAIDSLLRGLEPRPVLIDVGASVGPPSIWQEISRYSIYVGFDPDLRGISEISNSSFHKATIINRAVTTNNGTQEVLFYLTKYPQCSSTLKPHLQSLSNYSFADLFAVEKEVTVPAITLDSTLHDLSLRSIDWLKLDTQGTDLRIFDSLKPESRSRVLAIDIEPGLIDAYVGEDLFVDVHRSLVQDGFWLSNIEVWNHPVRIRSSTLRDIEATNNEITRRVVVRSSKRSPAWVDARYFRTLDYLASDEFSRRDYVLMWIFAVLDHQIGFALDLATEYELLFGKDESSQVMKSEPIRYLKQSAMRAGSKRPPRFVPGLSRSYRLIKRLLQ